MAKDHRFTDWKVIGVKCSFDCRVVISRGHIVESWRAELEKPSSISEIRNMESREDSSQNTRDVKV
jgi:hypothetical protein